MPSVHFFPSVHTLKSKAPARPSVAKTDRIRITKKPRLRRASFLNDFFTNGRVFSGKHSGNSVIFRSDNLTRRRLPQATATSPLLRLARCARVIPRAPLDLRPRSSWQGCFPPPLHPPARSVAPWTSPDALRLLDFRPGRFHQPLDPRPWGPSCPPWTPRPRETSLSLWTPIDQAFAAMDRAKGSCPLAPPSPCFVSRRSHGCKPPVNAT